MDSIFQYVDTVSVANCVNLSILLPSSLLSFRNVTMLLVSGCKQLTNLVTSSAAKSLVALVEMKIFRCKTMKQVVKSARKESINEEIVFSKLKRLSLVDLDRLTCFGSGK